MASVSSDSDGNRRIQFTGADDKRHSIYLGKMALKTAQAFKTKVEAIVSSQMARQTLEPETARWLASHDQKMFKKLVAVGLAERREEPEEKPVVDPLDTVHGFVDDWLTRHGKDVKESTSTSVAHTVRNIKDKFPADKLLAELTEGDADDFKSFLKHDETLAPTTVARRSSLARSIFKDAKKRRGLKANPFGELKGGSTSNPKRQFFVSHEIVYRVIDACPNKQRKLLIALSRFGGLRVPSEAYLLKWEDIDWERDRFLVHSPKTEHHEGKETRIVPIFPELRPYLEDVFHEAPDGAEYVLYSLRHPDSDAGDWNSINAGTMLHKILRRAKIQPWPRIWHNMRASRQTELNDQFPSHVVTAWLGNSEKVANAHYNMVTEDHFTSAAQKPTQIPTLQHAANRRNDQQTDVTRSIEKPIFVESFEKTGSGKMVDEGFEPPTSAV